MTRPSNLRKTVKTDDRSRVTLGALTKPGIVYLATKNPQTGVITLHPVEEDS